MKVSINPSYNCNFRCKFCYLTPEQLGDKKRASLGQIRDRLRTIVEHNDGQKIDQVDLYGGEIGLLDEEYLSVLLDIIEEYAVLPCNIITNLSKIHPVFLDDRVQLSVSFDFQARQAYPLVYNNMALVDKKIAVLILASEEVINMDVDTMIVGLNCLRNITSVEIKPYSTNQANQQQISFIQYEDFVKKWVNSTVDKEFLFINEQNIKRSLNGDYNAFSDDHIYITPNGKFGVLDFDDNDNELFLELDTYDEYLTWARLEKHKVYQNGFCSKCPYLGKCLTEHYREVKQIEKSCNGFKLLLDWYNERNNKSLR